MDSQRHLTPSRKKLQNTLKCKLKLTSATVIRQKALRRYLKTSTEDAHTTSSLKQFHLSIRLLAKLKIRQLTRHIAYPIDCTMLDDLE